MTKKIKILDFEFRHNKVWIETDFKDCPYFVYPDDRFASKADLLEEINKKAAEIDKRVKIKKEKKEKLEDDLNA